MPGLQAGRYRELIRNGKDPAWLCWTEGGWEVIPERAQAVGYVIQQYGQGQGVRILDGMRKAGMALTDGKTPTSQLYRIIRQRELIGKKTLEVEGWTCSRRLLPAVAHRAGIRRTETVGG